MKSAAARAASASALLFPLLVAAAAVGLLSGAGELSIKAEKLEFLDAKGAVLRSFTSPDSSAPKKDSAAVAYSAIRMLTPAGISPMILPRLG